MTAPRPLPKPVLHAAVLCDKAIAERVTNKWTLVGTFTTIYSNNFPAVHPELALYLCVSDAEGRYPLSVEIDHLGVETTKTVLVPPEAGAAWTAHNRLEVYEEAFLLRGLTFHATGKYMLRVLLDGHVVGEKPIWVKAGQPTHGSTPFSGGA